MRERLWTLAAALAWVAFCAAAFSMPVLLAEPGDPGFGRAIALQVGSAIFGIGLLAALLFNAERPAWPSWSRWLLFLLGAGCTALMFKLQLTGPWPMALHALALAAIAMPVGYWIGSHMERATHLVPLAVAMSMADIFSVARGPSRHIADQIGQRQSDVAERTSEMLQNASPEVAQQAIAHAQSTTRAGLGDFLVVNLPRAGQGDTSPLLGIGDLIALAFIFRTAWVHRLNPGLVFGAALGSTFIALALAQLTGLTVPALPVICLGVIGTLLVREPRLRRLDRQEIVLSVGVVALFAALIAARWVAPPR